LHVQARVADKILGLMHCHGLDTSALSASAIAACDEGQTCALLTLVLRRQMLRQLARAHPTVTDRQELSATQVLGWIGEVARRGSGGSDGDSDGASLRSLTSFSDPAFKSGRVWFGMLNALYRIPHPK
jgi:hypothetical protein